VELQLQLQTELEENERQRRFQEAQMYSKAQDSDRSAQLETEIKGYSHSGVKPKERPLETPKKPPLGAPSQSGKKALTVPEPFGFDLRAKTRPKSIRERRLDELSAEKETKQTYSPFRAKPVPTSTLEPRFDQLNRDQESRRLRVKEASQQLTKERELPFSFYERDLAQKLKKSQSQSAPDFPQFKANPIPKTSTVLIYERKMHEEEL
jgi:hypothetical protein